jgi:hypothetical protein
MRPVAKKVEQQNCFPIPSVIERLASETLAGRCPQEVRPAFDALIEHAEETLRLPIPTILDKKPLPPSDDPHDYFSLSIYVWPNPDTPDGLPYIIRDGEINPEVENYDRPAFTRMVCDVIDLCLAYKLTGRKPYARQAAQLLRAWFIDAETRMNPHMEYAQYIPGNGDFNIPREIYPVYVPGKDGKGIWCSLGGTIEACTLPVMLEYLPYLRESGEWSQEEQAGVQQWFAEFLHWLETSQHGRDDFSTNNNHGIWHVADLGAFALAAGQPDKARKHLAEKVPARMDIQFAPDGSQPPEMVRRTSFGYVCFSLWAFMATVRQARQVGLDLWNYSLPDGRSIPQAAQWLHDQVHSLLEGGTFPGPGKNIHGIKWMWAVPVLSVIEQEFNRPGFADEVKRFPEEDFPMEHRFRLLYANFSKK